MAEGSSNASFIPKRSTGSVNPIRTNKRIYIFSYVAYVVFFGTLLSVVGIFILERQAKGALDAKIQEVSEASTGVNQAEIAEIRELSNRLQIANYILDNHAAPSRLFEALEETVVESIQLTSFKYEKEEDKTKLSFDGKTETFDALMFQRTVMEENEILGAADIVKVAYGSGGSSIEGANRDTGSSESSDTAASVTFTYEDETLAQVMGYTPRTNTVFATESSQDEELDNEVDVTNQ